jgi:hypothetical protein
MTPSTFLRSLFERTGVLPVLLILGVLVYTMGGFAIASSLHQGFWTGLLEFVIATIVLCGVLVLIAYIRGDLVDRTHDH